MLCSGDLEVSVMLDWSVIDSFWNMESFDTAGNSRQQHIDSFLGCN